MAGEIVFRRTPVYQTAVGSCYTIPRQQIEEAVQKWLFEQSILEKPPWDKLMLWTFNWRTLDGDPHLEVECRIVEHEKDGE